MIPAAARSPAPAATVPVVDPSQAPRPVPEVQPVARTPSVDPIAPAARRAAEGQPRTEPAAALRPHPSDDGGEGRGGPAPLAPPASIAALAPASRQAAQRPRGDRAARSAPAQVRIGTIDVTVTPPPPTPTAPAPVAPAALTGTAATTPLSAPVAAWYGLAQR